MAAKNWKIPALEKWGTGRVGGVSRALLSTLLRVYFVKWVQTSGSNLKVSNKLLMIPLLEKILYISTYTIKYCAYELKYDVYPNMA